MMLPQSHHLLSGPPSFLPLVDGALRFGGVSLVALNSCADRHGFASAGNFEMTDAVVIDFDKAHPVDVNLQGHNIPLPIGQEAFPTPALSPTAGSMAEGPEYAAQCTERKCERISVGFKYSAKPTVKHSCEPNRSGTGMQSSERPNA